MLSLWNPLVPVVNKSDSRLSMKSYFDRLFEDSFDTMVSDLFKIPAIGIESKKTEDGSLLASIDIPGIKEEDISIEIKDSIAYIEGKRQTATSSYSVKKAFNIPEGYDTDNIKAELANGVLTLTIASKPLPAPPEVKKIAITSQK